MEICGQLGIRDLGKASLRTMELHNRLLRPSFYRPPTKLQESNIFSHVCLSVCLSTGGPMWPLHMMHWISLYREPPGPNPGPPRLVMEPHWPHCTGTIPPPSLYRHPTSPGSLVVTSGGQDWRSVQTCSLEDIPPQLLLTSGGCSREAGGMHPSRMFSCSWHIFHECMGHEPFVLWIRY